MQVGARFNLTNTKQHIRDNVQLYNVDDIQTELVGDLCILVRKGFNITRLIDLLSINIKRYEHFNSKWVLFLL